MIPFAELRAQAWRIGTLVVGVLAVALLLWCMFLRNGVTRANVRADAESRRAQAAEARVQTLNEALARDATSNAFTAIAQQSMDTQAATTNARLAALEGRTHDRPPVPVVCPSPDADLVRESDEAASRIRASGRELRDLRVPKG